MLRPEYDIVADCLCDVDHLCQQPACVAERAEEEAKFLTMFNDSPNPIAYTTEDLRNDRVYGEQPYKYEDLV